MIYTITEAQRQQLLDALKEPSPTFGKTIAAIDLLQSLAPVDAEAVGYINEMDEPVLFNDKPGRPDKRRKEAAVCVGSGWQYLYTRPLPAKDVNATKPNCKECAKWVQEQADNKEWQDGVAEGKRIVEKLVAKELQCRNS